MALETLTTISPITNKPVLTRTGISSEELNLLPETAQKAFRSFSEGTTLAQRQEIVARALGIIAKRKDELGREITEQMGRPISYTGSEITTAVKRGEFLNRTSSSILGEDGVVQGEPEKGFKRYIKRKPVGVVLIIFAWNVSQNVTNFRQISLRLKVTDFWAVPVFDFSQQFDSRNPRRKRRHIKTLPPDPDCRGTSYVGFRRGRTTRECDSILSLGIFSSNPESYSITSNQSRMLHRFCSRRLGRSASCIGSHHQCRARVGWERSGLCTGRCGSGMGCR